MQQKDFSPWNNLKPQVHSKNIKEIYFYEREIWFVSCGLNVGFEQDGKGALYSRPVIILRKFSRHVFWGVPLTKILKEGKYYLKFQYDPKFESCAILSQLKLFDVHRLVRKDGRVSKSKFKDLKEKIRQLI